jgi:beta-lactam-binding protein with PASTA domain
MRVPKGRSGRTNGGYPYRGDESAIAMAEHERPTLPPPGPPPPVPPPDDNRVWPWLLAFVVLALAAGGAAYAVTRHNGDHGHRAARPQTVVVTQPVLSAKKSRQPVRRVGKGVPVPAVVGMTAAKAATTLQKAGFVPVRRLTASPKPKGIVVGEQPPARTKLVRAAKVNVLVSNGPPLAVVPSLIGQPEQAAVASLGALGLKAHVVQVPSTQKSGIVVAESPKSGTKAPKDSSVRLNVAIGGAASPNPQTQAQTSSTPAPAKPQPATVSVPDVGGLRLGAARNAIRNAGLVTEIRHVPSQLAPGTVTGQSPKPGATAKRGDHVFLTVAQGGSGNGSAQQLNVVPSVVGQSEAAARQALLAAGFVADEVDRPTSDQSEDGVVVGEEPQGGTKASSGSNVTVFVGRYSPSG